MKTNPRKQARPDYQALQDELERRYGEAQAQAIVEEIRKVEDPDFRPGYMPVKAASEVLELFREEARSAIRDLKLRNAATCAANDTGGVADLELKRLHRDLEKVLGLYSLSQRSFYRLYQKAIGFYSEETPATREYKRTRHDPEMAAIA
jgi:hypothetical protein